MSQSFIMQIVTEDMLSRVTRVCAQCYDDIKAGDTIHYDMQQYRYICQKCHDKQCEDTQNEHVVIDEEDGGLFS